MTKKLYQLLLCSALLCFLFVFSPAFAFEGGSGTPDEPYLIATEEQLDAIREDPYSSYALCKNIILTQSWIPIGDGSTPFMGNFDGRGYEISGLKVDISGDTDCYAGLFGYALGGSISNLTVSGSVSVQATGYTMVNAGGIAGVMDSGSITNCRNLCSIKVENANAAYAGGIVGLFMGSELERCCNNGEVYVTGCFILGGGIAGTCFAPAAVADCYNTADVTAIALSDEAAAGESYAGGISANSDVLRCYNTGSVYAESDVSAISGSISAGCAIAKSCCFLSGTAECGLGEYYGLDEPDVCAVTEEALRQQPTFSGFDFESVWTMEGDKNYPYPELRSVQRNVTITDMSMASLPAKLEYIEGEALDLTGGKIKVKYSDLTEKELPITEDMISGFDSACVGNQRITINCPDHTLYFDISVKAKAIVSLELASPPDSIVYPRTAEFDPRGMKITAKYDNGKEEDVTALAALSGFSSASPGEYTVTAEYGGKSLSFPVYVFGFSEVSLSLEGSVSMNFYASFPGAEETGYTPCILFFRENPGNDMILSAYEAGNLSKSWIAADDKLMCSYRNIAAKEMSDDIYAVLCAETEAGPVFTPASSMSVARYASAAINSYSGSKLQRLMVDMLNYGTSAQLFFDYGTDSLANSFLTPDQLALGTSSPPSLSSITTLHDDGLSSREVSLLTASLSLDNEISMNIYAEVDNGCEAPSLLTFEKYISGSKHSVDGAKSSSDMVQSSESYAGFIPNIAPRYFRTPYYARVYAPTESGDAYSKLLQYSVESYAASVVKGNYSQSFKDLMNTMMKYGDSAAAYFGG